MTGTFTHTIDAKGRLSIPARLRDELGDVFHVTISFEDCLCAYSEETWTRLNDKLKAMPLVDQVELRPLFSHAVKCEIDGQGRILLPQNLRDDAGLKKIVTIVGAGEFVQFWNPEVWTPIDSKEKAKDNMRDVMKKHSF
jgi:MraZ protein